MRPRNKLILNLGLAALLCPGTTQAMTLEEVITKHIEAKGGRDNWRAVQTLSATGSFTSFSKVNPFTLHRAQPNKYYLDYFLGDRAMTVGFDGTTAWQEAEMRNNGPQEASGPDLGVIQGNAELVTPLFDYAERGYRARLLEDVTDLDGVEVIAIELTRTDDSVETWYLDAETFLEAGRDSPGSDFGRPMPQRTYFDDFRQVANVMIPHYVESQFYTRTRVLEIEHLEVNVELGEAVFSMPPPTGMGPFLSLAGDWNVAVEQRDDPRQPWQESQSTATIESFMRGALLEEHYVNHEQKETIRTLSYDRYRAGYRLTQVSDQTGHLDVQQGTLDEEGRLSLSNKETGTTFSMFGMTFNERCAIFDVTEDGFRVEREISRDGGENWMLAEKLAYTRRSANADE